MAWHRSAIHKGAAPPLRWALNSSWGGLFGRPATRKSCGTLLNFWGRLTRAAGPAKFNLVNADATEKRRGAWFGSPPADEVYRSLVSSRHHHQLRARATVVEYVEVGGEGRSSTRKGELHGVGASCVLSQSHRSVQAGALGPGGAVGQHDEVGAARAGHGWS